MSAPWTVGRHMPAGSLKLRSTAGGITIRATGAAAAMLAGAVRRNLEDAPGQPFTTVKFKDEGQDVLEWELDADQVVTDSRPFQAYAWKGARVVGPVAVGVPLVFIHPKTNTPHYCQFSVVEVVEGRR